ncbi:hypothetical protein [Roseimaritima sediminicola]|uniref:hypothetical protein n=1 Tax=Roseimaritima sediminicola TaxID=2662066 RepID=UPI0012983BF3|nr:hypothetical protein [Roseimaritima sediminicola]
MHLVTRNRLYALLVICATALTQTGCMGLVSTLLYSAGGDLVPAEFDGLEEQRVAVIVVTDSSQYSDDIAARMVSREVSGILSEQIKEIDVVREDEIDAWRDTNNWDQVDFLAIGRGVKADKVVAYELTGLKLRDGATLFRGQVSATTTVFDVESGKREFRRHVDDYSYPITGGQYTSETTEARFRRVFLHRLSEVLARYFHPYDYRDSVALDADLLHR